PEGHQVLPGHPMAGGELVEKGAVALVQFAALADAVGGEPGAQVLAEGLGKFRLLAVEFEHPLLLLHGGHRGDGALRQVLLARLALEVGQAGLEFRAGGEGRARQHQSGDGGDPGKGKSEVHGVTTRENWRGPILHGAPGEKVPKPPQGRASAKVSQSSMRPESKPRRNQATRWAEVPWVKLSGVTVPWAERCKRSSPMAAAAASASSRSPLSSSWRWLWAWCPQRPAKQSACSSCFTDRRLASAREIRPRAACTSAEMPSSVCTWWPTSWAIT